MADLLRSYCGPTIHRCFLRIYCGSAAGPLIFASPLFTGISLRIYCGSTASPLILRAHCLFIAFLCGSTADLLRSYCGPTIYRCFLRIYTVDLLWARWLLRAHCLYSVSLRIYCGSAAGPLIIAGPLFIGVSLRIYCGSAADLLRAGWLLQAHCL